MNIAIIADDLTGAADSGVQLARSGYRTAVVFRGAPIPSGNDLDAVAVDTDSRPLPAGFAAKRVVEAGHAVRDARVVYKKIDSTLRGPIPAELAAALGATGREKAIVAPAFPSAGRRTEGGVQLVHGEPVHATDLVRDPRTPVPESHIPSLLSEAFHSVTALSVADIREGAVREALGSADCIVADTKSDADLVALVRAVPDPSSVLWAGSAGLAKALGEVYPGPRSDAASEAPASSVLVVAGSVNQVTREQLRRLTEEHSVTSAILDTAALISGSSEDVVKETAKTMWAALSDNRCAVLYSAAGKEVDSALQQSTVPEEEISKRVANALARVVFVLSGEDLFDALVLTGGDTAVRVACELGATGILLHEEIEAGIPTGTLIGPHPYRVVTKAGGFGNPDTLHEVLRALTNPRKDEGT